MKGMTIQMNLELNIFYYHENALQMILMFLKLGCFSLFGSLMYFMYMFKAVLFRSSLVILNSDCRPVFLKVFD